ncbi:hypothetical protein ECC02_001108 [Trypanosoma cruzi]|uniref:Uncharacterized protein n=1 Tax=Trypanosoma cruzi TaxID=5693 RepID=A0A7J6YGR4_TRYCR|nr:hypothetical protein ECC02_001108 [Trypanosoma cruzi]
MPPLMLASEHRASELPADFLEAFPTMVRDVSLRGDIRLPPITPQQQGALFALAAKYGSACSLVMDGEGKFHLRNGSSSPHLQEKLAEELRYLHDEGEKSPEEDPLVLHWAFTDRNVHREVVTMLQLLAYDMGIFLGEQLFDGVYIYRVEVALRYLPQWEAERRKLIDSSLQGEADPFPIPVLAMKDEGIMDTYRKFIRPFLYEWDFATTRCEVNLNREPTGQIPKEARSLGSLFSLRHEVDSSGKIFFRRWTRHLLHVFSKYAEELRRQDSKGIKKTLSKYGGDLDPVDTENITPHFGHFNCCLEARYYKKDLAELEEFARRSGYFVHVSIEGDLAIVLATARMRPTLAQRYTLVFPKETEHPRRPREFEAQLHGRVGLLDAVIRQRLLLGKEENDSLYHKRNDKKVSRVDLINASANTSSNSGSSSSSSKSSSRSSSSSIKRRSTDNDKKRVRGRIVGIEESRWGKEGTDTALEDENKTSTPTKALPALNLLVGNEMGAYRRFSLAESNLYDTIVGKMQRNLPPGWSVRRDPAGKRYILDHLRGRAHHGDSSVVSMEFAAGQREIYNVVHLMI